MKKTQKNQKQLNSAVVEFICLDRKYDMPERKYFSDTETPKLYHETKIIHTYQASSSSPVVQTCGQVTTSIVMVSMPIYEDWYLYPSRNFGIDTTLLESTSVDTSIKPAQSSTLLILEM